MKSIFMIILYANLLLIVPTYARYLGQSYSGGSRGLNARQSDDDAALCIGSCELDTCGGSSCSLKLKRGLPLDFSDRGTVDGFNQSFGAVEDRSQNALVKRIFKIDPANAGPDLGQPTTDDLRRYLHNQWTQDGGYDNQYGPVLDFFFVQNGQQDERAYSRQIPLGNAPVQVGQGNLAGCTQVLLVSNRAVWMAHFWESYSLGKPNQDGGVGSKGYVAFEQRVLAHLRGDPVDDPDPGYYPTEEPEGFEGNKPRPYIAPSGPAIDPTLFNQDGDKPELYIMSRARERDTPSTPRKRFRYLTRMNLIQTTIKRHLGVRSLPVLQFPYVSVLDQDNTPVANDVRGTILFQYDPNSDGRGTRRYRVMAEEAYHERDLS